MEPPKGQAKPYRKATEPLQQKGEPPVKPGTIYGSSLCTPESIPLARLLKENLVLRRTQAVLWGQVDELESPHKLRDLPLWLLHWLLTTI